MIIVPHKCNKGYNLQPYNLQPYNLQPSTFNLQPSTFNQITDS
ncbi:hypothetical protein [Moorena sp. SIOASIH]|nr:hypothetical protein [Moorena sp. SIOASIH]